MQIIVLEDHDRKKYCDYVNLKVSKMIAAKFVFFFFSFFKKFSCHVLQTEACQK